MSKITITENGATVFQGQDAVSLYRAITLKHALGMLTKGITVTRGFTYKYGLALAGDITKKTYKRKDIEQAIKDLDAWCEAMKAALPIENKAKGD